MKKVGTLKWNPSKWKQSLTPVVCWWFHFDPYPHGFIRFANLNLCSYFSAQSQGAREMSEVDTHLLFAGARKNASGMVLHLWGKSNAASAFATSLEFFGSLGV